MITIPGRHTQCSVFLDADQTFFDAWKGTCAPQLSAQDCLTLQLQTVTIKMIDVL